MTHLPPSGFIGSMATGRGTRASRFSSACAHCFSHGVIHLSCAFAYYYPRNANHIFRREIFRFRAAFAVSPLALSRSLADSVFKDRAVRTHFLLGGFVAHSVRPLRPSRHLRHFMLFNANQSRQHQQTRQFTLARTPSITRNGRKWAETDGQTRHARKTVLTRNRPAHTPRTPTHTRDAHTSARHARQRTHTCTHTHASACTRTHAHTPTHAGGRTRTRTRSHPRTRRGPRARAHARPRTGGTSRAAPSAMQTRRL